MTNLLKELSECNNGDELQEYLSENIDNVHNLLLNSDYAELNINRQIIDNYLHLKLKVICSLNTEIEDNLTFLTILLDISERFELSMPFQKIYRTLKNINYSYGERINASALFLFGINTIHDYENIIDDFIRKLSIAFETEEDTEYKVVQTLINYYSQVVNNFSTNNLERVLQIKEKIIAKSAEYYFLQNDIVTSIFNIEITENEATFNAIQAQLDKYLSQFRIIKISNDDDSLFENDDTEYAMALANTTINFASIRQISVNRYKEINDSGVFHSLQRGVSILTEEKQLYAYMHSFGKMHYEKLITSFEFLPNDFFNNNTNIIDWGCGQGMATMVYFEYLNLKRITQNINKICLIEPSEIALKRGALHISKFNNQAKIITVNKDLDSLENSDFKKITNNSNLHLFSNIIDIDLFSLSQLLSIIEKNFKGINYIICVSPYITDTKANRIDKFVNYFDKFETTSIKKINNQKGEWNGNGDWTRVVRIFKTIIR